MTQPKLRFKREDGNKYPVLLQCSIKEVSSIKNGPFGSVLHSSDYVPEGTPIITTEHFKSGIIQSDVSTIPKVSEEDYKRLKGYVLETGDIVFSRVGSIDINALVTERENGWLFSGRVIRVRLNSDFHSGYFHYLLSTQRVKNDIVARAVGQTMPSINSDILNSTSLVITTSYEEQQKIAELLSTVDEVIAQSEAEVQNLEQQKKAAMQKIFSQEVRFRRDDGTEFPRWEEKQLQKIFVERNEIQTITDDAPLLSFTIEQGVINPEDKKTNKRDFLIKDINNKKFALTEYNDIIYNPANLKFGAIHRNKLGRGVVSPIYAIFHTEENPVFMEYVVTNPVFIKKSLKYLEGTVIKLMTLKPRDFLLMKCYVPCLEEQQKIADFLSAYDETITYAKQELDKWKELKKGLLQQMFV